MRKHSQLQASKLRGSSEFRSSGELTCHVYLEVVLAGGGIQGGLRLRVLAADDAVLRRKLLRL